MLGDHSHAQLRIGDLRCRQLAVEAAVAPRRRGHRRAASRTRPNAPPRPRPWPPSAPSGPSSAPSRLAASRSYTGESELARLRRDAPQTQIGEGANDALLFALGLGRIKRRKR